MSIIQKTVPAAFTELSKFTDLSSLRHGDRLQGFIDHNHHTYFKKLIAFVAAYEKNCLTEVSEDPLCRVDLEKKVKESSEVLLSNYLIRFPFNDHYIMSSDFLDTCTSFIDEEYLPLLAKLRSLPENELNYYFLATFDSKPDEETLRKHCSASREELGELYNIGHAKASNVTPSSYNEAYDAVATAMVPGQAFIDANSVVKSAKLAFTLMSDEMRLLHVGQHHDSPKELLVLSDVTRTPLYKDVRSLLNRVSALYRRDRVLGDEKKTLEDLLKRIDGGFSSIQNTLKKTLQNAFRVHYKIDMLEHGELDAANSSLELFMEQKNAEAEAVRARLHSEEVRNSLSQFYTTMTKFSESPALNLLLRRDTPLARPFEKRLEQLDIAGLLKLAVEALNTDDRNQWSEVLENQIKPDRFYPAISALKADLVTYSIASHMYDYTRAHIKQDEDARYVRGLLVDVMAAAAAGPAAGDMKPQCPFKTLSKVVADMRTRLPSSHPYFAALTTHNLLDLGILYEAMLADADGSEEDDRAINVISHALQFIPTSKSLDETIEWNVKALAASFYLQKPKDKQPSLLQRLFGGHHDKKLRKKEAKEMKKREKKEEKEEKRISKMIKKMNKKLIKKTHNNKNKNNNKHETDSADAVAEEQINSSVFGPGANEFVDIRI